VFFINKITRENAALFSVGLLEWMNGLEMNECYCHKKSHRNVLNLWKKYMYLGRFALLLAWEFPFWSGLSSNVDDTGSWGRNTGATIINEMICAETIAGTL